MKQVPEGAQNFLEWLVESLYGFLEGIIGPHLVKRTFWFFATIFIFILSANWLGLIPGVGTIGWGHKTSHGFKIDQPLLRGANADVNLTLAMALVFFACWIVWALREVGPVGFFKELFAPKGESAGAMKLLWWSCSSQPAVWKSFRFCSVPSLSVFVSTAISLPVRTCWKPWPIWSPASAGCCRFLFISWSCW